MEDKKGITNTNAFQKILNESNRESDTIWVDKGSEFYKRSMKSWLEKTSMEMYSIPNEEKPFVAERFIRTWKDKIYKYMTSKQKNVYIDKLHDVVYSYNNKYHRTIKMTIVDVKSSTYIDYNKENDNRVPKFKVGNQVRISKYKNIFGKVYHPN